MNDRYYKFYTSHLSKNSTFISSLKEIEFFSLLMLITIYMSHIL